MIIRNSVTVYLSLKVTVSVPRAAFFQLRLQLPVSASSTRLIPVNVSYVSNYTAVFLT